MSGFLIVVFIELWLYSFYLGFSGGSNAIATATVTHALRPQIAVLTSAAVMFATPIVLYYAGFLKIADTISTKILDRNFFVGISETNAFVFLFAGLFGALIWALITYFMKLPNSTTHTLMGGIIGAGAAAFGIGTVLWKSVGIRIILMMVLAPIIGVLLGAGVLKLIKLISKNWNARIANKIVLWLQRFNLGVLSVSFSANQVQNTIGGYLLAIAIGLSPRGTEMPYWVVLLFSFALALGTALGGLRVVNTIGRKLYRLTPIHSLAAQTATNLVILSSITLGIPLSAGQIMTSAVVGVGASERPGGVRWSTSFKIVGSWFITLPVSALFGAAIYLLIAKVILGGSI